MFLIAQPCFLKNRDDRMAKLDFRLPRPQSVIVEVVCTTVLLLGM